MTLEPMLAVATVAWYYGGADVLTELGP